MPRIAKRPITIPSGVTITINPSEVIVKGPKGELRTTVAPSVTVKQQDNTILVNVVSEDDSESMILWGTIASHIRNMIIGVTTGFQQKLLIQGVGYTWNISGQKLTIKAGYSHPVIMDLPSAVSGAVTEGALVLSSIDKQLVGETAAQIRKVRPPEPYKGKGIRYFDEVVRIKAGKQAAGAA